VCFVAFPAAEAKHDQYLTDLNSLGRIFGCSSFHVLGQDAEAVTAAAVQRKKEKLEVDLARYDAVCHRAAVEGRRVTGEEVMTIQWKLRQQQ
jgi:hypothetical protein